ncbi:hypothetical protein NQ317_011141 [Molorchus minor]|uniref:U3 small nucleolar RNA-associated protein 6 N-terminal domain-containing protein n=1 Tax=Molorchus minor TaxID=1323400 RepID=A0ABQ9JFE6_9CUCU|nr:hypothetical protein NQ317_011141 [Molorchus minor]
MVRVRFQNETACFIKTCLLIGINLAVIMGEQVERHMESMTEEIEEMRRTKLFSLEETREILRRRKHFGYKINGVIKNLQDYKDYIMYEKLILKTIKLRRNKYRVADRKNSLEFKIIKRIKHLYEVVLQRFSNDFSVYLSYFKFCKECNYNRAELFSKPRSVASSSCLVYSSDLHQALNVIHKGLTIHKDCQALYSEAIQLEILNRDKDDWHKDNTLIIIERLRKYYSDEVIVWETLAQREKNGFHSHPVMDNGKVRKAEICISRCCLKYKEGKKPALWTSYLDCLIELQEQSDVASGIKKNNLLSVLEEANTETTLADRHFITWVKLTENEDDALRILEKAFPPYQGL